MMHRNQGCKFGTKEYEHFKNFIQPRLPLDLTYTETVDQLTEFFSIQQSFSHQIQLFKNNKKHVE